MSTCVLCFCSSSVCSGLRNLAPKLTTRDGCSLSSERREKTGVKKEKDESFCACEIAETKIEMQANSIAAVITFSQRRGVG